LRHWTNVFLITLATFGEEALLAKILLCHDAIGACSLISLDLYVRFSTLAYTVPVS